MFDPDHAIVNDHGEIVTFLLSTSILAQAHAFAHGPMNCFNAHSKLDESQRLLTKYRLHRSTDRRSQLSWVGTLKFVDVQVQGGGIAEQVFASRGYPIRKSRLRLQILFIRTSNIHDYH